MDNRTLILEAATRLFAQQSYEAVGIQQVAREVNLSKPTLYHYFQSKQGLLESILKQYGTLYLAGQQEAASYRGDVEDTLKQTARRMLDFYQAHPDYFNLYRSMCSMAKESPSYKSVYPYKLREYEIYKELFQQIAADHGNIQERHRVYAATFMGMLGTLSDLFSGDFVYTQEDLLHRMVHQFMHGIYS